MSRNVKSRRAFTLVEMLVALALTLILVYAIAHFYAILGDSVKDGRSMIEMNQQLRAVVERLKSDFDQLTIPVVPWVDEGGAYGYIEIKEGNIIGGLVAQASSDWDVNANNLPDAEFEFQDLNKDNIRDAFDLNSDGVADVTNLLGDCDDIIAMTIRAGATPFTGQTVIIHGLSPGYPSGSPNDGQLYLQVAAPPTKITNAPVTQETTAPYAEVVWWTSFNDSEPYNGAWDFKESRYLHRRQLLIRPDLNIVHPGDSNVPSTPYFCRIPIPTPANLALPQPIFIYDLHQYCDVSIRFDQTITASAGTSSGHIYFVANSLADLCKRQNRFMHISSDATGPGSSFPYALDLNPNFAGSLRDDLFPDLPASLNGTNPRHAPANNSPLGGSHYRWVLCDGGRKGEDIMLPNVLAFDIRVYDPEAVLRPDNPLSPTGVLQPGDPGYHYAIANNFMTSHAPYGGLAVTLPTGAYVDLGYGVNLAGCMPQLPPPHRVTAGSVTAVLLATLGNSRFATFPATPASYSNPLIALYRNRLGLTYDTWTLAYERDGIDQDGNTEIDQGTDGLDAPINPFGPPPLIYQNGIDDAGERETLPPYPHPLRGIQVRIRMYEPGTRQMRQATVIGDFVSE